MRAAILGGTFDPVHIGHLLMADEVLARLGYDQIRFVPARIPPHKSDAPRASAEHRLAMLRSAVAGRPEFAVDPFELESTGVSYTVRTLRHLAAEPDLEGRPGLIIGQDLVRGFESWREVDEIDQLAELILVRRPVEGAPALDRKHVLVDNLTLEISSTEVRERIGRGLPFRYLVVPAVYEYIRTHRLYQ
ncbi:MAG: nicotinate-nucleotide adenylyltransferase [Spirochaetota bacterium]